MWANIDNITEEAYYALAELYKASCTIYATIAITITSLEHLADERADAPE